MLKRGIFLLVSTIVGFELGLAPSVASEPIEAAAPAATVEQEHDELRALRAGLVKAMNAGDLDAVLTYVTEDVVMTTQNGELSRGREGVRRYHQRMMEGPDKVVKSFTIAPEADDLTILYDAGTGVAFGHSVDHYVLTDGMDFELKGRWTATLVKQGGRWLIASVHVSTNLFDNPVLTMVKGSVMKVGILTLIVGGLVGTIGGAVVFRRRAARPA